MSDGGNERAFELCGVVAMSDGGNDSAELEAGWRSPQVEEGAQLGAGRRDCRIGRPAAHLLAVVLTGLDHMGAVVRPDDGG